MKQQSTPTLLFLLRDLERSRDACRVSMAQILSQSRAWWVGKSWRDGEAEVMQYTALAKENIKLSTEIDGIRAELRIRAALMAAGLLDRYNSAFQR